MKNKVLGYVLGVPSEIVNGGYFVDKDSWLAGGGTTRVAFRTRQQARIVRRTSPSWNSVWQKAKVYKLVEVR